MNAWACLAAGMMLTLGQVTSTVTTPQAGQPRDLSAQEKGTASLKGKVVAADGGRPIRRVQISLSSPVLTRPISMSTNSQGLYEFTDIPAGRYTVSAARGGYLRLQYGQRHPGEAGRPVQVADGQTVANIDFALPRASSIVGRITDELGEPLAGASVFPVQWRFYRGQRRVVPVPGGGAFNRTDDTGGYRITGLEPGDYIVMATTRESWNDEKNPKEKIGFLPTYSGGTANPGEAMRVTVGIGQEVMMPDFAMVPGRVGSISGTAMSSSGMPLAGESVSMSQEFRGPGTMSSFGSGSTKVGPDGSFTIQNVSPGQYRISVTLPERDGRPTEGASTEVFFSGDDIGGISLVTTPGSTVKGRVITDTGEAITGDTRMRVTARAEEGTRTFGRFDPENGRVQDDMTFELLGVFGANRLSLSPLPRGWQLRSIEYQGKDLVDTPMDFTGGTIEGVTILLTKNLPTVSGTLTDGRGQRADGNVVIFPEDASKWAEGSRLIRTTRPDPSGRFEFNHMVPGEYLVAPVDYVRDHDRFDPDFLENLRPRAERVRVDERGTPPALSLTLNR